MKVLVVDDDVVSRMMLMHLIDSSGNYEIVEAEDGADAWQQLSEGLRPAVCFCDLRMPRLSGMELLQKVRADAALATLPFVLVSSANDRETVEQATRAGANGYIVKPFEPVHVRAQLDALAARMQALEAEEPAATQARLGIDGERLQAYLAGFETQLLAADAELEALLGRGAQGEVAVRLERLRTGCATLGLHGAARVLAGVPATPHELAAMLAAVLSAVRRQAGLLRE
ncbi:two-component system chemotaxis response regulator CheY [Pseudoduganella flava]|uniref:Response regulator n=1 Tax=Pseudoduganella flava TaxID=871742 RepID=A0A562Q4U6_9BURK|nr:response regulator [Pseudoduganella flava]QGZ41766.1 response regulator [Pseudoduganella flava]TWI51769.1 two-component system chemotaxis response regulator CheY [Pseudoduganella flava]